MTTKERQALVLDSRQLVSRLVQGAILRHGLPETWREELSAAGNLGLVQAAARFDPDRGVRFTSFATYRVYGAIIESLRDLAKTSVEVPRESLDTEMSSSASPEERVLARQEVKRLHEAMMSLRALERELIGTHYEQATSLGEVADRHGISKGWASRLRERAVETLRDHEHDMELER